MGTPDFDEPRTTLGACFSILANKKSLLPMLRDEGISHSVVPP